MFFKATVHPRVLGWLLRSVVMVSMNISSRTACQRRPARHGSIPSESMSTCRRIQSTSWYKLYLPSCGYLPHSFIHQTLPFAARKKAHKLTTSISLKFLSVHGRLSGDILCSLVYWPPGRSLKQSPFFAASLNRGQHLPVSKEWQHAWKEGCTVLIWSKWRAESYFDNGKTYFVIYATHLTCTQRLTHGFNSSAYWYKMHAPSTPPCRLCYISMARVKVGCKLAASVAECVNSWKTFGYIRCSLTTNFFFQWNGIILSRLPIFRLDITW